MYATFGELYSFLERLVISGTSGFREQAGLSAEVALRGEQPDWNASRLGTRGDTPHLGASKRRGSSA